MALPTQPVTLSVEQVAELNRKLAAMRHDLNGVLSVIVASMELIRYKPQTAERMLATMSEQPAKINAVVARFSAEFEQALGITKS